MKIRELYSDESKWCQHAIALNGGGVEVDPESPSAVSWCLMGALTKCYGDYHLPEFMKLTHAVRDVVLFNNSSTFEEVKALVERLDI